MEKLFDYSFKNIQNFIVGGIGGIQNYDDDHLIFIIHSNNAPVVGDIIEKDFRIFECISSIDVTTDEEKEEGLSYNEVELLNQVLT
jgi:hypothetical protein